MESNQDIAIEHQNVPIAHQGLHNFLYSSDDEHQVDAAVMPAGLETGLENDGTAIVPLPTWCDRASSAKIAGVYAVLDSQQQTQYIGYSRNVLVSLGGHLAQNGEDTCAFVRVQAFKFPKRTEMEALRDAWMAELGSVPPGNSPDSDWASSIGEVAKAVMSAEERQVYEEKKLKLRKAMADTSLTRELEAQPLEEQPDQQPDQQQPDQRQQNLKSAVQNDDWSAVIQTQTQETL
ncbi:MAG TPA: GIY-YIG nuclease family protein [Coleofasciculaceae cyanobacterium]